MNALDVVAAIDKAHELESRGEPRSYIGASIIGNPCDAALAYSMRGFDEQAPDPQLKRIFGIGHVIEDMVVRDLRKSGLAVHEKDPMTGRQWHHSEFGGHVSCNLDGHIYDGDEIYVLEVKSMNDNNFAKFMSEGVRSSHLKYWYQMQMCMGMGGYRKTLFIAYNKNTSKYHAEIVEFDEMDWLYITHRIETVLGGGAARVAKDETDWRCRSCWRSDICWGHRQPSDRERSRCASCTWAQPHDLGGWRCTLHDRKAAAVCDDWSLYTPETRT